MLRQSLKKNFWYFFYKLPYRGSINRKINKPHRKRCCYYVFFGSFHTKLNLLLYVSEILLKLSENPRDWQRISFMLYKEFNQTEKVRTQLYLIISDIIRWRNFPLKSMLNFSAETASCTVVIAISRDYLINLAGKN